MSIAPITLERICAAGWPGVRQRSLGEWLMRFGNGFTSRANSVLVLGSPGSGVDSAVAEVGRWYAAFDRRPLFQLPTGDGVPPQVAAVDAELARRGWTVGDRVAVLTGALGDVFARCRAVPQLPVTIESEPGPQWLASYLYRGRPLPPTAVEVLRAGPDPAFLSVTDGGAVVGVARGVVTDGWLGVTAVTVAEPARRSGVGTAVMAATLRWGADRGAGSVYLQVDRNNTGALAMYAGMGFGEHHGYRYRLPPAGSRAPDMIDALR